MKKVSKSFNRSHLYNERFFTDFDFIRGMIHKSMSESCKKIICLLEETNPELEQIIKGLFKKIAKEINVSCHGGVSKVNDLIADHLTIPDNVLLRNDQPMALKGEEAECEDLAKSLTEVSSGKTAFIV